MASTSSRLPIEVIGRIMRYVSHPCADLIRQLGLVHEHPARTQTYTLDKLSHNYVFTDGHNDASGWIWAHHYAHLHRGKRLWSDKCTYKIHEDILRLVSHVYYRYDRTPLGPDDGQLLFFGYDDYVFEDGTVAEDDEDEDDDDEDDDGGWDWVYG